MSIVITLLTGGGLLAAGSILTGWQNSRLASKRDEATHAHERQMAQEARRQDRLERAYTELGIYLARHADWARSVRPFRGQPPAPDPMQPGERWRIEALVKNHGSPEVRGLLERWTEIARKIENADAVIGLADRARGPAPELDEEARREKIALGDYRKALYEAADDIHSQVQTELNGQTKTPALPERRAAQAWMLMPPDPPLSGS